MCKLIITGYVKNKKPFVKDMLRYVYVYICICYVMYSLFKVDS